MSDEYTYPPTLPETFWAEVTECIGTGRLRPRDANDSLSGTSNPEEPEDDSVWFNWEGPRLSFGNAWGFVVTVCEVGGRRKVNFTAEVTINFDIDIDPGLGRMEHPGGEYYDWSTRPQPHEKAVFQRVTEHNSALTRVLREAGLRRPRSSYSPPAIFRCPHDDDPTRVQESRAEVEAEWVYEAVEARDMAETVARLMEVRLSTSDARRWGAVGG